MNDFVKKATRKGVKKALDQEKEVELGGSGSGDFDHTGQPGKVGGSGAPEKRKKSTRLREINAVLLAEEYDKAHASATNFHGGKGGIAFRNVPLAQVHVDYSTNREVDPAKVLAIQKDITKTGTVKPLIANKMRTQPGHVKIEDGHHRALALKNLGAQEIPLYEINPDLHDRYNTGVNGYAKKYHDSKLRVPVTFGEPEVEPDAKKSPKGKKQ